MEDAGHFKVHLGVNSVNRCRPINDDMQDATITAEPNAAVGIEIHGCALALVIGQALAGQA